MNLLNTWKPARKYIVYFALALFSIEQSWFFSSVFPFNETVEEVIKLIYVLAIALVFLLQDFSIKMFLIYGLLGAACILTRLGSGQMFWIFSLITILALRQEDITDVLRLLRRCLTLCLIISTLAFFCDLLQGQRQLFDIDDVGRHRARLGFSHANTLSTYFFNLVMLWVWEKFDSIDWKALACILLTALGMYLLTDSRTAFLCEILLCLLVALAKYGRKAAVLLHYAAKWAAPAGAVFTLITTILWITTPDLPFLKQLNRLLSGRVYLSAHAFSHYGITLFGQPLAMDPVTVTPEWPTPFIALDNVYAYFFCCMGTIWLILICLSFYRLGKLRDSRISISLILWAVYGISEMLTIRVYYFFPLLLICIVFQPKEELARRYPAMEGQRLSRSPILPD